MSIYGGYNPGKSLYQVLGTQKFSDVFKSQLFKREK